MDEQPLTGALTGKLLALFLYLAVTATKGAPPYLREALAAPFWRELPPSQLQAAHRLLQDTMVRIEDAALRQSFLENIPWRRALWTLVQTHRSVT